MPQTRADPPSSDEAGGTRGDVDNITSGVVDDSTLESPATTPNGVSTCEAELERKIGRSSDR